LPNEFILPGSRSGKRQRRTLPHSLFFAVSLFSDLLVR
jgi:hypothetical protein